MRLAPPPPDIRITPRHEHDGLLRALSRASAALDAHEVLLTRALDLDTGDLDTIDLPPGAPSAQDRAQLQAAAPLYFASELESAGLLPTAELIAGLFASGAINQPLGPVAQLLNTFWHARRERLGADERRAIFARVIEAPYFDRMMAAMCEAIVAQAGGDLGSIPGRGVREQVQLETTAQALGEFLAQRVDAMAAMAARDIVANIELALGFMRDRLLQTAFGVRSLWQLIAVAGSQTQGPDAGLVQRHVDQGRAGQSVLLWLAEHAFESAPLLDLNRPADLELIGAAQRWLSGRIVAPGPVVAPALPIAA